MAGVRFSNIYIFFLFSILLCIMAANVLCDLSEYAFYYIITLFDLIFVTRLSTLTQKVFVLQSHL